MVVTRESPVLYLSLADLAEAVYDGRLSADDLKRANFCFVHDEKSRWESGLQALINILRIRCIIVMDRVEKTYEILEEELSRAERKGRLIWKDPDCIDPWAELNRLLVRQGFKTIRTNRQFNTWAVTDEVKKLQLPLRVVSVPDY